MIQQDFALLFPSRVRDTHGITIRKLVHLPRAKNPAMRQISRIDGTRCCLMEAHLVVVVKMFQDEVGMGRANMLGD